MPQMLHTWKSYSPFLFHSFYLEEDEFKMGLILNSLANNISHMCKYETENL